MADPKLAISKTIQNEGGFVDSASDPGGATKYGITQADMPGVNIADITEEQAIEYYLENYWKPLYSEIANQEVASKIFDMGVLFGVGTAVKIFQETLGLPSDGLFGENSLADANVADPTSLLKNYKTRLVTHALDIVASKPALRVFITGWIRRINS